MFLVKIVESRQQVSVTGFLFKVYIVKTHLFVGLSSVRLKMILTSQVMFYLRFDTKGALAYITNNTLGRQNFPHLVKQVFLVMHCSQTLVKDVSNILLPDCAMNRATL